MAKKTTNSDMEREFLAFNELRRAIKLSFGRKSKNEVPIPEKRMEELLDFQGSTKTLSPKEEQFVSRKGIITTACIWFSEFSGLANPLEMIHWGKKAMLEVDAMGDAIDKLHQFKKWIVLEKKVSDNHAVTMRGNFKTLLRYHSITIKTDDRRDTQGERRKARQAMGIRLNDQYDILQKMEQIGDFEMKAFISCGMASGHRKSDLVNIKLDTMKALLAKGKPYVIYTSTDEKEGATINAVFCPYHQMVINNYIETINDDREYLFGDKTNTSQRLSEKFETLLHKVYDGEDNVLTPHIMRSMVETEGINKGYVKDQVYTFTGHKDVERYIRLTDEQMLAIAKSIEEFTTFKHKAQDPDSKASETLVDSLLDIVSNEGKMNHYAHLYSEFSDDPSKIESQDAKRRVELKIASVLHTLTENVAKNMEERITKNILEKLSRQ